MKNIFIICLFAMVLNLASNAQTTMTGSGDTIVNTATKTNTLKLSGSFKEVLVQSVVTKISGTVAGTLTLQGSIDGTNYVTADSSALHKRLFVATNVTTQSVVFVIQGSPYLYYRVSYTGVGTMSATLSSYILGRKVE